jgi:hypothetical protein
VTSVKVEAWGGGGSGGGYDTVDAVGGGGGGGGEYAAEATFAVTPGNGYAYAVGAGGTAVSGGANGRTGSDTTFGGTITAHGGTGGTPSAAGIGGSGSTNTAHFSGGVGSLSFSAFGGGGASSGGFSSAGNSAATDTQAGAAAVTGGGGGGAGGTSTKAGTAGMSPGGGGGGAGSQGTSGAGANGRVTITFTPPRTLLASIAGAAGTDDYGNAYPQGISGSKLTVDGVDVTSAWQSYTPTWTSSGTNPTLGNGSITGRYMRIGKTVHATIRLVLGSTSSPGTATYLFSLPFTSANDTVNYLGTARFTAASLWIGQVTLGANSNLVNATFPSSSTATTGANMSATTTPWSSPPTGNTLLMSITYQIA